MSNSFLFGLIGAHVTGSLTPLLVEQEAQQHGLRCVYRPLDPEFMPSIGDDWSRVLKLSQEFGYNGCNVTHPAKQMILESLDVLTPEAAQLGAVNTVVFSSAGTATGHNTDHVGFRTGLQAVLRDTNPGRVVLIGTGGAGSAIAYALLQLGVEELSLYDLDVDRAEALRLRLLDEANDKRMRIVHPAQLEQAIADADGIVNATPVGMVGHFSGKSPVPAAWLRPELWVSDAVYRPLETRLIREAKEVGCRVVDGGYMVVGQAAASFELFTGQRAQRERMYAHFLQLLSSAQAPRSPIPSILAGQ